MDVTQKPNIAGHRVQPMLNRYPSHLLCFRGPRDRREADVILLNDGRVETVEVKQQNELVIEAFLWLQHQASFIRWLPSPRLLPSDCLVTILVISMLFTFLSGTQKRSCFFREALCTHNKIHPTHIWII